jgi:hypothetical protein
MFCCHLKIRVYDGSIGKGDKNDFTLDITNPTSLLQNSIFFNEIVLSLQGVPGSVIDLSFKEKHSEFAIRFLLSMCLNEVNSLTYSPEYMQLAEKWINTLYVDKFRSKHQTLLKSSEFHEIESTCISAPSPLQPVVYVRNHDRNGGGSYVVIDIHASNQKSQTLSALLNNRLISLDWIILSYTSLVSTLSPPRFENIRYGRLTLLTRRCYSESSWLFISGNLQISSSRQCCLSVTDSVQCKGKLDAGDFWKLTEGSRASHVSIGWN